MGPPTVDNIWSDVVVVPVTVVVVFDITAVVRSRSMDNVGPESAVVMTSVVVVVRAAVVVGRAGVVVD